MSSILTIRATTPYTATVMTRATTTRMISRGTNAWSATSLSAITMISADRMKSVRMAPGRHLAARRPRRRPRWARRGCRAQRIRPQHLLGALVAEVGGAEHQDRRQQPRQELTEQQRGGQDEQQLVAQRADRDPLDHRQFAVGGDAVHVLRRHRGVVDDDAGGLGGRAAGGGADVVDRRGRQPGQRRDVVEKTEQTCTHRVPVMTSKVSRPRKLSGGSEPDGAQVIGFRCLGELLGCR